MLHQWKNKFKKTKKKRFKKTKMKTKLKNNIEQEAKAICPSSGKKTSLIFSDPEWESFDFRKEFEKDRIWLFYGPGRARQINISLLLHSFFCCCYSSFVCCCFFMWITPVYKKRGIVPKGGQFCLHKGPLVLLRHRRGVAYVCSQ